MPTPVLWALSWTFLALAIPSLCRLVLVHPASELRCRVNRLDEAAELLMCLGMLAMVCPLGGPIPLAGWQAAFGVASTGLAVAWVLQRRRPPQVACAPSRCGHHAISAGLMLAMLVGVAGHGGVPGDPWLVLAGHGGSPGIGPLGIAAAIYLLVDTLRRVKRAVGGDNRTAAGPALFGLRSRESGRAVMNAAMATMLLSMA